MARVGERGQGSGPRIKVRQLTSGDDFEAEVAVLRRAVQKEAAEERKLEVCEVCGEGLAGHLRCRWCEILVGFLHLEKAVDEAGVCTSCRKFVAPGVRRHVDECV